MKATTPALGWPRYGDRDWLWLLGVAGFYLLLAWLAAESLRIPGPGLLVWPSSALGLAALLIRGRRLWPAVFVGAFLAGLLIGYPAAAALVGAAGKTVGAVLAASVLRPSRFDLTMEKGRDYALLILACALSAAVNALVGVGVALPLMRSLPDGAAGQEMLVWLQGDLIGMLLFGPILLGWWRWPPARLTRDKVVEAGLGFAAAIAAGHLLLVVPAVVDLGLDRMKYLLFAFMLWSAVRFGQRGAWLLTAVYSLQALRGFGQGTGPFGDGSLAELGFFLLVLATTGTLVGLLLRARSRAESTLRASEERYRLLVDTGALPVAVTSLASGRILFANRRLEELLGFSPGGALGHRAPDLWVDPGLRARLLVQLVKEGRLAPTEVEMRRLSGERRWIETTASVIEYSGEKALFTVLTDVTERRRAETARAESEATLSAVIESTNDFVFSVDADRFALLTFNKALRRYMEAQYGVQLSAGQTPYEILPAERAQWWSEAFQRTLRDGGRAEEHILAGGARAVMFSFNQIRRGAVVVGISVFGRDITELRKAEADRALSERLALSTIDALEAHLAILDETGTILAVNEAWRIFARENNADNATVSPGANYLAACERVSGPSSGREFAAGIRSVIAGKTRGFEMSYPCHAPGQMRWFTARVTRLAGSGPVRVVVAHENVTKLQLAAHQVEAMDRELRLAQEFAGLGSYVYDIGRRRWTSSPVLDRIFGLGDARPDRAIEEWVELVHPEEREELARYLEEEVVGRRGAFDREYRIIRKDDGAERWMYGQGGIVTDSEGQLRLVGSVRDVTAAHQHLEALRDSERRFRSLADALPNIAVYGYGPDRRILFWNPACEAVFGLAREEALGRRPEEVLAPAGPHEPEAGAEVRWAALEPGTPETEFALRRQDGRLISVISRRILLRQPAGTVETYGIDIDVTAHRAAEAQVREQAALLDVTQDAIYLLSPDRIIRYMNRAAEGLHGLVRREAEGRRYDDVVYREAPAGFAAEWQAFMASGTMAVERQQMRRSGEPISVQKRATLMRDEAGRPKAVLVVLTDITESKRLEQHHLRAQRMESLGTLAAGVAHDLNNVLTPIIMAEELLRRMAQTRVEANLVHSLVGSARRGAKIVQQLSIFGRGTDTQRAILEWSEVLPSVIQMVRETFPRNLKATLRLEPDLWPVEGDRTQLEQVLLNLCLNARDAMPNGGELEVSAAKVEVDQGFARKLPDAKAGLYVRVQVADHGVGIPPAHLEKIFDPFFTTKQAGHGAGLGLATVLGIVRSHGGFVQVESAEGKGSTFSVYFPAHARAAVAAAGEGRRSLRSGRGELVLVVDDEEELASVLRLVLEQAGYRVETAANGAEALGVYARHAREVRLVVTDLMMPVMDGAQLLHALRGMRASLPAVVLSGQNEVRSGLEKSFGRNLRFLSKPVLAEVMLRVMRELLDAEGDNPPPT